MCETDEPITEITAEDMRRMLANFHATRERRKLAVNDCPAVLSDRIESEGTLPESFDPPAHQLALDLA